jgi:hypothetical protein
MKYIYTKQVNTLNSTFSLQIQKSRTHSPMTLHLPPLFTMNTHYFMLLLLNSKPTWICYQKNVVKLRNFVTYTNNKQWILNTLRLRNL